MPETATAKDAQLPDFPLEIEESLHALQRQCAAIVEAVCGSGSRAKDVSDSFGVHAKLGWQVWNVAYSHPLTVLRFLPNEHGINVFRRAATEKGVDSVLLDGLEDAVAKVFVLIEIHAEDREMFEMLVDAQAESPSEDAEQRWRKQSFYGNSFVFGARAKTLVSAGIFFPSRGKEPYFSILRLQGIVGLIRTRAGIRWPFASSIVQQVDRTGTNPVREPFVPTEETNTVPLIPSYCSQPLPQVNRRMDGDILRDELMPTTVGQTGSATVFTGEILHDIAPAHGIVGGEVAHFGTGVRTPAELFVGDHIVHKSVFPEANRELRVYSELISSTTRDDRDRIDVSERLEYLGSGLKRARISEVPAYVPLLQEAFERIGFDPREFEFYRARLKYPPMPASVMVRHLLPPPPG